jgi:hypothetical protein
LGRAVGDALRERAVQAEGVSGFADALMFLWRVSRCRSRSTRRVSNRLN